MPALPSLTLPGPRDVKALRVMCSKLRYYRKFLPEDVSQVALYGVYDSTMHDSHAYVYQCAPSCLVPPTSLSPRWQFVCRSMHCCLV